MSLTEQIKTRLAEFFPVYQEIGKMLSDWKKLQWADQAGADHQKLTSSLEEEIKKLDAKRKELAAAKLKRTLEVDMGSRDFQPPIGATGSTADPVPVASLLKERPRPVPGNQEAIQRARTQLKKLVGRWGRLWKLSSDVQGRINRIADDPARTLGEALALLEWTTFEHRIGSSESEEDHLVRVGAWGAALIEYRDRLSGEIDMLKTKYKNILPILDAWIIRDTEAGRRSWEQQISETNAAKRVLAEKLRQQIASATAEELTNRRDPTVD